jgi:hypothetical protein
MVLKGPDYGEWESSGVSSPEKSSRLVLALGCENPDIATTRAGM